MENRLVLFGLHELEGIGWKTILKLFSHFTELRSLLGLDAEQYAALGIKPQQAALLSSRLTASFIEARLRLYQQACIEFITILDEDYPIRLKETAQPPWVLYCKGNRDLLKKPLLGMVGTRTPTAYGKKMTDDLASDLAGAGFGIVSGLARGIDSTAHQGALRGGGATIGVLGCAINVVYPPENLPLYRDMEQRGLLVSEYGIGTAMHPGLFPQRNRIIAGLSLGVIVVEAAQRSGSLITVDHALDESRDVFAVPGPITSPKSQGTLSLIKQGAKMVTGAEDIIEEYLHLIPALAQKAERIDKPAPELTEDEQRIVSFLSCEPTSIDQLVELSQFTFGHLHSVLLSLLMNRVIVQLPGSTYTLL